MALHVMWYLLHKSSRTEPQSYTAQSATALPWEVPVQQDPRGSRRIPRMQNTKASKVKGCHSTPEVGSPRQAGNTLLCR